jgi:hypothetical protein
MAVGTVACLAFASPAFASNHEIKIREVYAGDIAHPADEYIELQMYAPGQNLFHFGTTTTLYGPTGSVTNVFSTAGQQANQDPPNGDNQDHVLIATATAQATFVEPAGYTLDPGDHLSPAGGAVCYEPTAPNADCVSWGNFSGGSLPSPTGGAVDLSGIPDTFALRRSIEPGCSTLLEAGDDTNNPNDWQDVVPDPLNNAEIPTEHACPKPPNTTITKAPGAKTTDRTPTFKFKSSASSSTFKCKLDDAAFRSCESPFTTKKLGLGKHTFKVRATAKGQTDPSPAHASFKIVKKPNQ